MSCAEIRESETVVKDRGYTINKKTWYTRDHKRTQKYEWTSVDTSGTIVSKKYRNRFGKYRGWSNMENQYQYMSGYITKTKYKFQRRNGSRSRAYRQVTTDSTGAIVAEGIRKRNGDCLDWSLDYRLDKPRGFKTLTKRDNCGRASNDFTPSGYVVIKRWNADGKLVDIQRFKKDGRILVYYRYFDQGKWIKLDHADNEIWNRFNSE